MNPKLVVRYLQKAAYDADLFGERLRARREARFTMAAMLGIAYSVLGEER